MIDVRENPLLKTKVIISEGRNDRPIDYSEKFDPLVKSSYDKSCPFCPRNEKLCAKEKFRVGSKKNWKLRAVNNKYPVLDESLNPKESGFGVHEVLIENRKHNIGWYEFSKKNFFDSFFVAKKRALEISKIKGIKYVMVYKNHGKLGGASLVHSHMQILASKFLPSLVLGEEAYAKKKGCLFCGIVKHKSLVVYENKNFLVVSPYWASYPFEMWVVSKRHYTNLFSQKDFILREFCDAVYNLMQKVKRKIGKLPFNLIFHYYPASEKSGHFHAEFAPRVKFEASVEQGFGVKVNTVSPNRAWKILTDKV